MTPISFAGTGAIVVILETLAKMAGLELPVGSVAAVVNDVVYVGGMLLLIIGQLRRPDLHFGLVRKS